MEEKSQIPAFTFSTRSYYLLTKPGIIMGNLITTGGGFALASQGRYDLWLFLAAFVGLGFVIASACVFNNAIDRKSDAKMARTKKRPLVTGEISVRNALVFAVLLGLVGAAILANFVNFLSAATACFGFLVYVLIYSYAKYLTTHGTLIGSVAGAVPPVVGYTAVTGILDAGAFIFFAMIALWQMPHFYAISIFRMADYEKASIPVLPIKRGMQKTKVQIALYLIAFIGASSLLYVTGYTGTLYLAVCLFFGAGWLILALQGFRAKNEKIWARKMFLFSLIVITALCLAIPFSS